MNIAVFCSGYGSNLQAIINAIKAKRLKAVIKFVFCDKQEARCLKRAKKAGLKTITVDPKLFKNHTEYDKEIIKHLEANGVELVVLAGFMRILSNYFVRKYRHRILNVHPSLLPAFKGAGAIKKAYNAGVKVTGATIHFVNERLDSGPIILQDAVKIKTGDTLKSVEAKIHKLEHRLYPKAIELVARGRFKVTGDVVKVLALSLLFFLAGLSLAAIAEAETKFIHRDYSSLPAELSLEDIYNAPGDSRKEWDEFFCESVDAESESWRPLTKEEYAQREKELAYSAAKAAAEFFDSIYLPYVSRGLFNIIGMAYEIEAQQHNFKKEHGFSFDVDIDDMEVNVKYERKY